MFLNATLVNVQVVLNTHDFVISACFVEELKRSYADQRNFISTAVELHGCLESLFLT